MNRIKRFSLILVFCILAAFSWGCYKVYSTWVYGEALSGSIDMDINLIVMPWEGADELPNHSETGNNHKTLINNILGGTYVSGGTTQNVGLNTENSYLVQEINERKSITWRDADRLGSMDIWQSDRITEYFSLNEDSNKVAFILEFPDETEDTYYLYTTSVDLGDGWSLTIPEGTNIYPIYRTTLQRDAQGKWGVVSTEVGYAKSAKYANPLTGLKLGNAFDTASWTKGELGTEMSNAVYTTSNFKMPVETITAGEEIYYYYDSSSNANLTVTVADGQDAVAYVYDANGQLVSAISGTQQGSQTVTFTGSRNTRYYIKIANGYCTFTIA